MIADFKPTRRAALALLGAAALTVNAGPAAAQSVDEAKRFIEGVIDDLRGLIRANDAGPSGAAKFLDLLRAKAALPQVGKFAAGRAWREMNAAQQAEYQTAFESYIARTYQKRFGDYAGEDIIVTDAQDVGSKGVLIKSRLTRPNGQNFAIEWLVTDRLGPVKLADIVFEGVSLSITLRELFGGMIDKRNGDLGQFIADLKTSEGA